MITCVRIHEGIIKGYRTELWNRSECLSYFTVFTACLDAKGMLTQRKTAAKHLQPSNPRIREQYLHKATLDVCPRTTLHQDTSVRIWPPDVSQRGYVQVLVT